MLKKYNKVSDKAVKNATGKNWEEWIEILNKEGAEKLSHREIAKLLFDKYKKYRRPNGGKGRVDWWAQMITVGYEYAKGKRTVGKTEDVGYEIGVQKMIPVGKDRLWKFLVSGKGQEIWLGEGSSLKINKGEKYKTNKGTEGEVRTIINENKLRLTFRKWDWRKFSTLQLSLFCPRNSESKTNLRFHQENLTSSKMREEMRRHWRGVLNQITEAVYN